MKTKTIILLAIAFALSACGDNGGGGGDPICGNDLLETGEECDSTRLDGKTCLDFAFASGTLSCNANCTFNTTACVNIEDPCGNGDIETGEDCDGDNLGDETCEGLGYVGGELSCTAECAFDESDCQLPPCGDGQIGLEEECDGDELGGAECTDLGFNTGTVTCSDECLLDYSGCDCEDDDLEENDTAADAAELTPGGHDLNLCNWAGEEDWFSIDLTTDQELLVVMNTDGPVPDVDLELIDELGMVLDSSNSSSSTEQVLHLAAADMTAFIRVFTFNDEPGAVSYSLNLIVDPECIDHLDCLEGEVCDQYACVTYQCDDSNPCPDNLVCDAGTCVECVTSADCPDPDVYTCDNNACVYGCTDDANEPDDLPGEATILSLASVETNLRLCGEGALDWFSIELEALHDYEFTVSFSHAAGNVDAFLYAADELDVPVALATSASDDEQLVYPVGTLDDGTYYLKVVLQAPDQGQTYSIVAIDQGPIECAWDDDCLVEEELCLDHLCLVPDCLTDEDCTGTDRCVGYLCVPMQPGDTCDDPLTIDAQSYSDENREMATYRNDLEFEDDTCTGWPVGGKDVIYQVTLAPGESITAVAEADFDVALYLIEACGPSPMPAAACLAGVDDNLNGPEELIYVSENGGSYHLVVDAFAPIYPPTGIYSLNVEVLLP